MTNVSSLRCIKKNDRSKEFFKDSFHKPGFLVYLSSYYCTYNNIILTQT